MLAIAFGVIFCTFVGAVFGYWLCLTHAETQYRRYKQGWDARMAELERVSDERTAELEGLLRQAGSRRPVPTRSIVN